MVPLYRALGQLTQVTFWYTRLSLLDHYLGLPLKSYSHFSGFGTNAQSQGSSYVEASYESISKHIRECDPRTDIFPSVIMVSTAIRVHWEHHANIIPALDGAPSLADLRQEHFNWIRNRLAELGDRATHLWQYSLLLESLQSYSDLFELLYAGEDIRSSALLLDLSLCPRDMPTDSTLSSPTTNDGSTYYTEEALVLAKKLLSSRNNSNSSALTILEGTDFSQRKF